MRGVTLALVLVACEVEGTLGRADLVGGGSGDAMSGGMTDTETTTASSGTQGEGEGGGSGGGSSGSGESAAEGGASSDDGVDTMPTDVPHACIVTPDDGACAECRKANCCQQLVSCLGNDACTCTWFCMSEVNDLDVCSMECLTDSALYGELRTCEQSHCDACG